MNIKQFTPPQWLSLSLDRNKFVCFFIYSFFLLFFLSPDSYLYNVYLHYDSAVFFTCGKAWMNGLVPYVDFADSKGPLLWLIYGMGYLLNSHSYVGVFWISCVFYAVSFTFAYKICRLYLDRRESAFVVALLPIFLFYKQFHSEVITEDYCNTFIFISLYSLCRIQNGNVDKHQLFKYAFAVGASMICCLLIKWNFFFMVGGVALAVLYVSIKKNTLSGLWGGLTGMAAIAAPFIVYFIIQGNFEAFITEYFVNTALTVKNITGNRCVPLSLSYQNEQLLIFIGVFCFCHNRKGCRGVLFSLLVFLILELPSLFGHYFVVITPFCIFALIAIVEFATKKITLSRRKVIILFFLCVIVSAAWNIRPSFIRNSVFVYDKNLQSFYDLSRLMATVEKPKIMSSRIDFDLGILADALPACRYWIAQSGLTDAMIKERQSDLLKRKADFVLYCDEYKRDKSLEAELNRLGYVYCGDCYNGDALQPVYCKKELYRKLPPVKLRTIDLLLKRDILSGAAGAK